MTRWLGVALALLLAALAPAAHADDTQAIARIELTPGTRDAVPAADALWQSHTLPMR